MYIININKMKKKIVSFINSSLIIMSICGLSVMTATAADDSPFGTDGVFYKLFSDLNGLISGAVIALLIGITIALFFWALVRSMARSQGGTKMAENKAVIGYGIAILFVMVSIWGIIVFFQDAVLGKKYGGVKTIVLPTVPQVGAKANTDPNNPITPKAGVGVGKKINGTACSGSAECISGYCGRSTGPLKCEADTATPPRAGL